MPVIYIVTSGRGHKYINCNIDIVHYLKVGRFCEIGSQDFKGIVEKI